MLLFNYQVVIEKPTDQVFDLIRDRSLMLQWQPGVISSEETSEKNGRKRYKLSVRMGNRTMPMIETIEKDLFPEYVVRYEVKGVMNTVRNSFAATPSGSTLWTSESSYHFKGLMKLIGPFFKSGFDKQNRIIMHNFKSFAEKDN